MGLIATEEGDIEACEWVEDCRQAAGSSFSVAKIRETMALWCFFFKKRQRNTMKKHYDLTLNLFCSLPVKYSINP